MTKNRTRKGTPDIMGGLMGSESHIDQELVSNKAIKQESNIVPGQASLYQEEFADHKEINPASNKTIKHVSNKAINEPLKEKTTFNLSLATLNDLDNAWVKLRQKLKGEQRITKTLIVEKAIEIALADLESKSELSDLYLKLKE